MRLGTSSALLCGARRTQDDALFTRKPLTTDHLKALRSLVNSGGRYHLRATPDKAGRPAVLTSAPAACVAQSLLSERLTLHLDSSKEHLVGIHIVLPTPPADAPCSADAALQRLAELEGQGRKGQQLEQQVAIKVPVRAPDVPKFSTAPEQQLPGKWLGFLGGGLQLECPMADGVHGGMAL